MKQVPIKLGPLALLLTVISICLTVLAILSFTTARADLRLAERYAATVTERYQLETAGQELLAELRDSDPGMLDMERDADGVWWTDLEKNGAHLCDQVPRTSPARGLFQGLQIFRLLGKDSR